MAHFAQLDENNLVINVVAVTDEDTADADGNEIESIGVAFLQATQGADTNWVQTSYWTARGSHPEDTPFRGHFAGRGMTYDSVRDVFIHPKPCESFVLNDEGAWEPPVAHPGNGKYDWDEDNQEWTEMAIPDAPFPSWTWNAAAWRWEPPTAVPEDWDDNNPHVWDEDNQAWVAP
jgi:hypothetical protein